MNSEVALNVDEQLSRDLAGINSLNEDQLGNLVDLVLSFILDPLNSDFQSGLGRYAETYSVNVGVLKTLVRGLIVFLQGAMKDGWSAADLESQCRSLSLEPLATRTIVKIWQRKAPQMVSTLLSKTIKANRLIDLDWSFGVTAASDDSDQVGKTYLQLKLTFEGQKNVFMELSLDQFYQFLAQMENCKSYLDFVST